MAKYAAMGLKTVRKVGQNGWKAMRDEARQGGYDVPAEQLRCDVVESGLARLDNVTPLSKTQKEFFLRWRGGCRGREVGNKG